jgi:hypothetical protein
MAPHLAQFFLIKNGANIQDGDFTFIHPSIRGLCFLQFWILIEDHIIILI